MSATSENLARGLFGQLQVIHALVLRETRTRFGKYQLGYIWALLEPVFMLAPFLGLAIITDRRPPGGMSLFAFLMTGVIPYGVFRSSHSRVSSAIDANRGLLFYPQVQPLDLNISRLILESATWLVSFFVLTTAEGLIADRFEIDNLVLVLTGFSLACLLGGSLGMALGALALYSPTVERISGPMLRPLLWISGIFFTANSLPEEVVAILWYNPLLHAVEIVRSGFFEDYTSRSASLAYLSGWVVCLTFVGLALERSSRAKLEF